MKTLSENDSAFLDILRGASIFIIVFGHVGGFWFFKPYSSCLGVFIPVFFFISGIVSYYSFERTNNIREYYTKRIVQLLVPYYLVCILELIAFIYQYHEIPHVDLSKLIMWLTMRPIDSTFPIGQVWFLHTLLVISLVSPVFFLLYKKWRWALIVFCIISLAASFIQMSLKISPWLHIAGHNLFKPLVHSTFFIIGFMSFNSPLFRNSSVFLVIAAISILCCITVANAFKLNVDFEFHTYAPDFYYVTASLFAIFMLCTIRAAFTQESGVIKQIVSPFRNINRYTFAIYLLHSFTIYIVEEGLGLVHPTQNMIFYGIQKFSLVFLVTFLISVPFSRLSVLITKKLLSQLKPWYQKNGSIGPGLQQTG